MRVVYSLVIVLGLVLIAYVGGGIKPLQFVFGVIIPYLALLAFLGGVVYRIVGWAKTPVPFRIPTTCGQQQTLSWIKRDKLESPVSTIEVVGRMLLEILLFRSLFRNTKSELTDEKNYIYKSDKWLWAAALVFHYSFLTVAVRHLRFFTEPTPFFVTLLESLDGFLQIGAPVMFMSGVMLLIAASYLFIRRIVLPQVRYISLVNDYFPLFLIIAIALTGILMRYVLRADITGVKELAMGLATFSPHVPEGVSSIFFVHIFLVSSLLAYFPFSKLVHMAGIFFSPTRNMANNNRMVRHENPWNYPVKVHTYEEYEHDYKDIMKKFGIPLDKES
jgi:nitrate reductase gamma subunit